MTAATDFLAAELRTAEERVNFWLAQLLLALVRRPAAADLFLRRFDVALEALAVAKAAANRQSILPAMES